MCDMTVKTLNTTSLPIAGRLLGEGAEAWVREGALGGMPVALKVYKPGFQPPAPLPLPPHDCILTPIGRTTVGGRTAHVLPLAWGDLYKLMESQRGYCGLPSALVARIMKRVLLGLKAMHDGGLVHGDLKAENVLVVDGAVLLSDFGSSRPLSDRNLRIHTKNHTCPRDVTPAVQTSRVFPSGFDTRALDVYAAGVMASILLNGLCMDITLPAGREGAAGFISEATAGDWRDRPTVDALLRHPFLATVPNDDYTPLKDHLDCAL